MHVDAMVDPHAPGAVAFAQGAEALGVRALWVPEVWGYDALTGLGFLAAQTGRIGLGTFVVQLGSRTPALLATSALSLQHLSGGRFRLGIGVSGPAVMEGWHGVRFHRPVQTTRETIEILRTVSSGERLVHEGSIYPLPLPESRGRALRPALQPDHVPVYVAAMGPANLRLTGEVADGWLGNAFVPETAEVFFGPLREGAESGRRTLADLDLVAPVAVEVAADEDDAALRGRRHADGYAFTIGAMGAGATAAPGTNPGTNFYRDAFARLSFADELAHVARLWQSGDRESAARAVPLELGTRTNLIGTPDQLATRVEAYRAAGITTLLAKLEGSVDEQLAILRTLVAVVAEGEH